MLSNEKITDKLIGVLKRHQVVRASLFGSWATGEMKAASDLDILVELPRGKSLPDLELLWTVMTRDIVALEREMRKIARDLGT